VPRLPRVSPANLLRALRKAGFLDDRQKGSHITLRHPQTGRRTVIPMHGQTLSVGLLSAIIKQAGLTPDELRALLQ